MKWITRERPKIDRIACPWLIKNFADNDAEFIYVPADIVQQQAIKLNAIPFDIPGVEFSHYEDKCTFDHMLYDEPRLFMMHFWAVDEPEKLAKGLKAALDKTNSNR
jgi:hypothetical protein